MHLQLEMGECDGDRKGDLICAHLAQDEKRKKKQTATYQLRIGIEIVIEFGGWAQDTLVNSIICAHDYY